MGRSSPDMIYFDLDDVVTDFSGYVNRVLNTNYTIGDPISLSDWSELRVHHPRIFADLEPIPEMIEAINSRKNDNIAFLSAIPFDGKHPWQWVPSDKFEWVKAFFPEVPLFLGPYSHDKYKHCLPGDILIDDKDSNCVEWDMAKGISYLYRDSKNCIQWLADQNL